MNRILAARLRAAACAAMLAPAVLLAAPANASAGTPTPRAAVTDSMGPLASSAIDIKNFGVVDGRIYRGAQPKGDDYVALAELGITTVVDLRADAKKDSRRLAEAAGLRYVNIPMKGSGGTPTDDDAKRFLETVDGPSAGAVYVHCAGGRHRTGSMIAVYRMAHQGWTIDQAYAEMEAYDFYTRNGHKGFKTYVEDFADRVTADRDRVLASIHEAHAAAAASVAEPPAAR